MEVLGTLQSNWCVRAPSIRRGRSGGRGRGHGPVGARPCRHPGVGSDLTEQWRPASRGVEHDCVRRGHRGRDAVRRSCDLGQLPSPSGAGPFERNSCRLVPDGDGNHPSCDPADIWTVSTPCPTSAACPTVPVEIHRLRTVRINFLCPASRTAVVLETASLVGLERNDRRVVAVVARALS